MHMPSQYAQKRGLLNSRVSAHACAARAPARPEQPSQWPMLDLTEPMSSGSSGVCPAPAPYSPSIADSSWLSPTTVPVPCASTYWMSAGSMPVALHTCTCAIKCSEQSDKEEGQKKKG